MANAILSTAVCFCIVALVAMIVAHALPYWTVYQTDPTEYDTYYIGGIKGHYGLWIGCREFAVENVIECAHDLTFYMNVTRVTVCVATVCLCMTIILSVVYGCSTKKHRTILAVGAAFNLAAGGLTEVGVAVYGIFLSQTFPSIYLYILQDPHYEYYEPFPNRSTEAKLWLHAGFYTSLVAGALSVLSGIFFIIAKRRINSEKPDGHSCTRETMV